MSGGVRLPPTAPIIQTDAGVSAQSQDKLKNERKILVILLVTFAVFVTACTTGVAMFCYRKRLKTKVKNRKKVSLQLTPLDEELPATATLIPEPDTPTGKGPPTRTISYASSSRRRISSSGSMNSSAPFFRYNRNGSYRSRLSSTVSSRLDSNISEGEVLPFYLKFSNYKSGNYNKVVLLCI